MTNNLPTVFTNTEIGISMQKMWLMENKLILTKTYFESNADFILVAPHDSAGKIAITKFITLADLKKISGLDTEMVNAICSYVTRCKIDDNVIVIFMNRKGRVSYYTMKSLSPLKINPKSE